MKVVMITTSDPSSTALEFAQSLERHTEHRCRLITTEAHSDLEYETDLHIPFIEEFDEIESVLKEADVFHFHALADENLELGPLSVSDFLRDRHVVHHHHGELPFRRDPRRFADQELALGRRALVSTPDLLLLYPEATWLPNAIPLGDPDYRPGCEDRDRGSVVVSHSPTHRDRSNTDDLEWSISQLRSTGARVRARIIEETPHRECLRLKRSSDIFFDHMQGHYSVSSLEALSQGLPTVAGLDRWNLDQIRSFTGSDRVPWIVARDRDELAKCIEELSRDSSLREAIGRDSRDWLVRYWDEARIARDLASFYESLE